MNDTNVLGQNTVVEIRLIDLFWFVLSKYRKVILWAVLAEPDGNTGAIGQDSRDSFLTVNVDAVNGLLQIKAISADEAHGKAMIDAVEAAVQEVEPSLQKSIHAHTVVPLGTTTYQTVSQELIMLHEEHLSYMSTLTEEKTKALAEYNKLKPPALVELNRSAIAQKAIKNAAVGFLLGGFLSGLAITVAYVFQVKLMNPESVAASFQGEVLGILTNGKKHSRFDQWIWKHRGLHISENREAVLKLIAANIRQSADRAKAVLIAGASDSAKIASICHELQPYLPEITVHAGSDLCNDADTVELLGQTDAVVLLEEIEKSRQNQIRKERRVIMRSKKPFLGFILTEKD